jgi:hypothetical protein
MTGVIAGNSNTWRRSGFRKITALSPHTHAPSIACTATWSTSSADNKLRDVRCWPGCPPRLFPVGGFFGRCTCGPSDDGGADEFVELRRIFFSMSASRAVSSATMALSAAFSAFSAACSARNSSMLMALADHASDQMAIRRSVDGSSR